MKRTLGFLGWSLGLSLLLGTALVICAASMVGSLDPAVIDIDGMPMALADFRVGHWLAAVVGTALALLIVALVVPIAVLVPLAIVAVALVGVLLVLAGVLAVVFSPLILGILAIWLIVRLMRRSGAKARGVTGATITG